MNKFLAFALFALVASVSCNPDDEWSQAEAASEGNVETDMLLGNERLFSDFCVSQGNKVKSDLRSFARDTNAYVLSIFFGSINDITDDVINVQKDVVAQLTAQLAKPTTEISSEEPISEDQIAKLVLEGKRSIQESNSVAGIVPASKTALQAMLSAANSAVFKRLAKARSVISSINLYQAFKDVCGKIAQYETDMAAALDETKSEIVDSIDDAETKSFVESTTVSNLNCFTTKNIIRLHGFCDIVQAGHVHFFKMLGMNSPLSKME